MIKTSYLILAILVLFWTSTSTDYAYGQGGARGGGGGSRGGGYHGGGHYSAGGGSQGGGAGSRGSAASYYGGSRYSGGGGSRGAGGGSQGAGAVSHGGSPGSMEEVTILAVAAITVAVVAIIGEVIIMAGAAIIGAVTIIAEDLIIGEVTGVEVSGSALDGAGLDGGIRGGVPRTMRYPLLLSSRNPRRMSSRSNRRRVTGIIARIQKVTTHMSRTVQAGGLRWRRSRLRLTSEGGHGRVNWARYLVLFLAGVALSGCATVPAGPSVTGAASPI